MVLKARFVHYFLIPLIIGVFANGEIAHPYRSPPPNWARLSTYTLLGTINFPFEALPC